MAILNMLRISKWLPMLLLCACAELAKASPHAEIPDSPDPRSLQLNNNPVYQFNLYLAHGIMMAIAVGLFLPIGALFPALTIFRNMPNNRWFKFHRAIQGTVFVIVVVAFLLIMFAITMIYGNLNRMTSNTPHGPLGIALFVIIFVQFMYGFFRPHAPATETERKSHARLAFEAIHPQLGHIIIVLAAVQLWYGYRNLTNFISSAYQRNAVLVWAYVHAIAMPVIFFALVFYSKLKAGHASLGTGTARTNPNKPPVLNTEDLKPNDAVSAMAHHNPPTERMPNKPVTSDNTRRTGQPSSDNQQQAAIV